MARHVFSEDDRRRGGKSRAATIHARNKSNGRFAKMPAYQKKSHRKVRNEVRRNIYRRKRSR